MDKFMNYCRRSRLTHEENPLCYYDGYLDESVCVQGIKVHSMENLLKRFIISRKELEWQMSCGVPVSKIVGNLDWRPFTFGSLKFEGKSDFLEKIGLTASQWESALRAGATVTGILRSGKFHWSWKFNVLDGKSDVDLFETMLGITKVRFGRYVGNKNRDTFDYAVVATSLIGVSGLTKEERIDKVKQIKKRLGEYSLVKLEESKRFKKSGVPINFMKLDKITLRNDDIIEYTFSLKIEGEDPEMVCGGH